MIGQKAEGRSEIGACVLPEKYRGSTGTSGRRVPLPGLAIARRPSPALSRDRSVGTGAGRAGDCTGGSGSCRVIAGNWAVQEKAGLGQLDLLGPGL